MQVMLDRTGRAYTNNLLDTVEIEEFIGIDTNRGHTHAMSHKTDTFSFVETCETKHTTNIIKLDGIIKEVLRHKFYTQRIAGYNHSLGDVA